MTERCAVCNSPAPPEWLDEFVNQKIGGNIETTDGYDWQWHWNGDPNVPGDAILMIEVFPSIVEADGEESYEIGAAIHATAIAACLEADDEGDPDVVLEGGVLFITGAYRGQVMHIDILPVPPDDEEVDDETDGESPRFDPTLN